MYFTSKRNLSDFRKLMRYKLRIYVPDNSGHNSVQLSTTQFYWVLKQAKTELYWVVLSYTSYNSVQSVVLGFKTELNGVGLSCTKI